MASEIQYRVGGALEQQGRIEEAEPYLRRSVSLDTTGRDYWCRVHLGIVLVRLRNYVEAEQYLKDALKLATDQATRTRALFPLAEALSAQGRHAEAISLCRELAKSGDTPEALHALVQLLNAQGTQLEADTTARQALEIFHSAMPRYEQLASEPEHHHECWEIAISSEGLGDWLKERGWAQEAEEAYRGPQAVWRKLVAVANTEDYRFHLAVNYDALGALLRDTGRFAEATEVYREALAVWKKLVSEFNEQDHRDHVAWTLANLARTLRSQGKDAEAQTVERELTETGNVTMQNDLAWNLATDPDPNNRNGSNAVVYAEKAVAATSRTNASYLDTLAAAYAETGQFAKAISIQQQAIALAQSEPEKAHWASRLELYSSAIPYRDHGALATRTSHLLAAGKFVEAEPSARECLALREKLVPDDWRTFNARAMLGGALLGQKKYCEETESMLVTGYQGLKQREDKIPPAGRPRLQEALRRLVQLYQETNRPDQAGEYNKKLAELEKPEKQNKPRDEP